MKVRRTSRTATLIAAAAVVAGSVTFGAGAATAQTGWEVFGSYEYQTPCFPCGGWDVSYTETRVENVIFRRDVPKKIERGLLVTLENTFFLDDDGIGGNTTPRNVTKVVEHPPAGLVFTGVQVVRSIDYEEEVIESGSAHVDRSTGAVTVEAPAGGWTIPNWVGTDRLVMRFVYHVPLSTPLGETGGSKSTFELAGVAGLHGLESANHEIVELNPENLIPFS